MHITHDSHDHLSRSDEEPAGDQARIIKTGVDASEQESDYANGCLSVTPSGHAITVCLDAASNERVRAAATQAEAASVLSEILDSLPFDITIVVGDND